MKDEDDYKGQLNDKTETDASRRQNNSCDATIVCGICLTEMNSTEELLVQCNVCKKCVHYKREELVFTVDTKKINELMRIIM